MKCPTQSKKDINKWNPSSLTTISSMESDETMSTAFKNSGRSNVTIAVFRPTCQLWSLAAYNPVAGRFTEGGYSTSDMQSGRWLLYILIINPFQPPMSISHTLPHDIFRRERFYLSLLKFISVSTFRNLSDWGPLEGSLWKTIIINLLHSAMVSSVGRRPSIFDIFHEVKHWWQG